ncbi:MAG: carboxymuconolactone decarboxylase family protein [Alphaproteobacteria bacterium]|jgi:alkylhydroperoxidase/carboxymuconolactone decarboxylase family protein YurZ/quercetin dioxygenase-like cupin family protein|nr:carboxymuconolactone decarboxylase family protein [Alphaproteobacteria bacterium]
MFKKFLIIGFLILFTTNISQGEIMTNALNQKEQDIAIIAGLTANGNINQLKLAFNTGLDNGLSINEIQEVLIQMYAYAGFPRSLNGLSAFMEVLNERQARGINDTLGESGKSLSSEINKKDYGNKVQIELTGAEVKGGLMEFSPTIDSFLKEHLFADIFGRGVLTYRVREIATIAALASMGGVESQLQAHINIGKHIGITDAEIKEMLNIASNNMDTIFAKGEPNPYGKFFTGKSYLSMLSAKDDIWNAPIGNVTFESAARTNWHSHSGGQILLVTAGHGYYQEKNQPARKLQKGDVVRIAPNVVHWHGAAPNSWFTHISIETNGANNQGTWLEPVGNEQYNQATK